jgi:hypothetical protein
MKKSPAASATPPKPSPDPTKSVFIVVHPGDDSGLNAAKAMLGPHILNAFAVSHFVAGSLGDLKLDHLVTAMVDSAKLVNANDMVQVEAMLMSQAVTLNAIYSELTRRSAINLGEYMEASQRYLNMALKAQNQCRMTLETLSNIKNPPVVYAKQANIANGPQQVNNGTNASQARENENPPNKLLEPSNDTGTPGHASGSDKAMAPMGKVDGAKVG